MREILFRGKTSKGEWVYGFYHNETSIESHSSERKTTRYHIYTQKFDVFVDSETIGQYIGLKDKNGTKIFKGDIVEFYYEKHKEKHKAVVEFDYYLCGWLLNGIKCGVFKFNYDVPVAECEVIGNIYDNPDLLSN